MTSRYLQRGRSPFFQPSKVYTLAPQQPRTRNNQGKTTYKWTEGTGRGNWNEVRVQWPSLPTWRYASVPTGQITRALSRNHSCSDDDGCYGWTAPYTNKSANIVWKLDFLLSTGMHIATHKAWYKHSGPHFLKLHCIDRHLTFLLCSPQ